MHSFLFAALMFFAFQPQVKDKLFPIPRMHEDWPSEGLTANQQSLLRKAHGACEFDYALVDLGKLGAGVLTRDEPEPRGPCSCRSNCAIEVYVWKSDQYREIPVESDPSGWAWGIVKSDTAVPYLAIGSNAGGGCQIVELFRYADGKFVSQGSEALRQKNQENPGDWWTPSQVVVRHEC
jgi:hypothetical protein